MDSSAYFPIERLRYWEGQPLRSRDFNDQSALDAQARWAHNRALHRAFGVRLGLEVSLITTPGSQRVVVRVSEGVAYDCFGRELVLCPGQDIAGADIPSAEVLLLLLRRKPAVPSAQTSHPECAPASWQTTRHQTELVWKTPGECDVLDGVPLARITLSRGVRERDPLFPRPIARALARPRIASGATVPGKTVWELFSLANGFAKGMQTHIDTTAAGFTETPAYFAWLEVAPTDPRYEMFAIKVLGLPRDIAAATTAGFTFRLVVSPSLGDDRSETNEKLISFFSLQARKIGLRICWLGCEHLSEAPVCPDECDCQCPEEPGPGMSNAGKENHHAH